ncbi:hypothetical protein WNY51_05880 [Pseudocolwellia sp. AS88]|uniref:hypothetical protein n=1 Tax=Pseudocolwellia sp. AS88 TaxID=3063958 RepID=UPI0026F33C26|nr:hypothetical protein [Pseudocolwellia sp. AS88]MDO7083382.1 hypothetical protein [Pseudocolwellia sp. AS88]
MIDNKRNNEITTGMRKLLSILVLSFGFNYHIDAADIYTCLIDGTTTFSQIPCGDTEQKIEVDEPQSFKSSQQSSTQNSENITNDPQNFIVTQKIKKTVKKIEALTKQKNDKLSELEANFMSVSNNRAGSLHQNEISKQIISTDKTYIKLINDQKVKLEELQKSLN